MSSFPAHGSTSLRDAKEYSRFCRIRGIFLVDGLVSWRAALQARGFPEDVISAKLSAANHFLRSIADPSQRPGRT